MRRRNFWLWAILLLLLMMFCLVLLAGCGCGFTGDKQAQVKAGLEMLQGGYDTSIGYLQDTQTADPKTLGTMKLIQGAAKLGVPLVDQALDQYGRILAQQCPDPAAVDQALAQGKLAAAAQQNILNLAATVGVPAPANPTPASAPTSSPAPSQ